MSTLQNIGESNDARVVNSFDANVQSEIWFKTAPLTPSDCRRWAQIQLTTDSCDQGFVSREEAGSWSWFEISVFADENATEPIRDGDKQHSYISHFNRLANGSISRHFGAIFDRGSDLFDALEPGFVLGVRLCTRFAAWSNIATKGVLTVKVLDEAGWTLTSPTTPELTDDLKSGVYTLLPSWTPCHVQAQDSKLASRIWFTSPVFDEYDVKNIEEVQLFTKSHDQGTVSLREAGSWSWFDIMILESPDATTPKVVNGRSLVWRSHDNYLADPNSTRRKGGPFTKNHEMLQSLEAGNVLAVVVCAQFQGWENHADQGRLVVRIANGLKRAPIKPVADLTEAVDIRVQLQAALANEIIQGTEIAQEDNMFIEVAPPAYSTLLRADEQTGVDHPPVRVLSLDGGGVRGLSSLQIIKNIMKKVDPSGQAKPCDYFDLIGGTSTGGLLAIMLGRLEMSIADCEEAYLKLSKDVFNDGGKVMDIKAAVTGGRYNANKLIAGFKAIIEKQLGPGMADAPMYDVNNPHPKCKVFVTTVRKENVNNGRVMLPRSYINPRDPESLGNWPIWQAARATSAAPYYFKPIVVDNKDYVDGGLGYNNPCNHVVKEAMDVFGCAVPFGCVLTVGTGIGTNAALGDATVFSSATFVTGLLAIATSCERTHQEVEGLSRGLQYPGKDKYFRFNVGTFLAKGWYEVKGYLSNSSEWREDNWTKLIGMDDWKGMAAFGEATVKFMELEEQSARAEVCASLLIAK